MFPRHLIPQLEALGRAPGDHAVRRVLADALVEAGDPRGEFIALTMNRREGKSSSATIQKKLAKRFHRHRAEWLGPLAAVVVPDEPWVSYRDRMMILEGAPAPDPVEIPFDGHAGGEQSEVWDLAFPARLRCRLSGTTAGAAEWLTVRELILLPSTDFPSELAHSVTEHLRFVWVEDPNPGGPERVREYLRSIGREALLDGRTEWPGVIS